MIPSFGGDTIFGMAVKMRHIKNPSANQAISFFGSSGVFNLWGGGRGRIIQVSGVLYGSDISVLNAVEDLFLSYDDGIARSLTDTRGRTWPSVIFRGEFEPGDQLFQLPNAIGIGMGYRAIFRGLL